MNPPQITLKLIVLIHFILSTWASQCQGFLPPCYIYMNLFALSIGVWSIVHHESTEAILTFFLCHIFTILEDIILLGIYEPRAYAGFERDIISGSARNEYRFSLGMCILNLIIKPITSFLIFRLYRERGGSYSDFTIPGVGSLPGFGGSPQHGGYDNIDTPPSAHHGGMEGQQQYEPVQQPYPEKR